MPPRHVVAQDGAAGPIDEHDHRGGLGAHALAEVSAGREPAHRIGSAQDDGVVSVVVQEAADAVVLDFDVGPSRREGVAFVIGGRVCECGEACLVGPVKSPAVRILVGRVKELGVFSHRQCQGTQINLG